VNRPASWPLVGALGDLVEDIVVELGGSVRFATDTTARISRRRGGSAANVAVAAVVAGGRGRYIGSVGDDPLGDRLVGQLAEFGVEHEIERSARTGTVVALIDSNGERSLLTDRGSSSDLETVSTQSLDGLDVFHVPAYAFTGRPLADAAKAALIEAKQRGLVTSIDVSAVPVVEALGKAGFRELISEVEPTVLFCNADEAEALGVTGPVDGVSITVVKQGPDEALIFGPGSESVRVPAPPVANIVDTTGAGDAFAAGFLLGLVLGDSLADCALRGHRIASLALRSDGALQGFGPVESPAGHRRKDALRSFLAEWDAKAGPVADADITAMADRYGL